jgi:hypothetical protein
MHIIYFLLATTLMTSTANAFFREATFRWLPLQSVPPQNTVYYIQKGSLYGDGSEDSKPMVNVDRASFEVAVPTSFQADDQSSWGRDKSHIFFGDLIMHDVDRSTFVALSEQTAKDKDHVYCWDYASSKGFGGDLNKLADPKTFKLLTSPGDKADSQFWYYRDANHIFNKWCTQVQGADPKTFEMVNNPTTGFDAKDALNRFALGKIVSKTK